MNMKNEKLVLTIVAYLLLSCVTLAGTIILSTDIELPAPDPDPNQVITVYFHSDAPLLFMNLLIRVNGDATLVGMMDQTNCGQYGWDESAFTCTVNPDNSIELFGLNWNENTASTVGYLQFTCNSGKVYIYLDNEESMAVSWTEAHTVSTESIRVGTLTLPPLIERDEPEFSISRNPLTPTDPCWLDLQSLFTMTRFAEMSTGPEYLEYGEPFPAVVIYSDITTNQVWEPNCVYIVAAQIYVQALLVIEPGTTVLFDFNCGMLVNNGGTLISEGTPDKPIIYSPLLAVDYEVEEDTYIGIGNWWEWYRIFRYQYISPMIIESTASPATSVSYSFVEGAQAGVILDGITLDKPIENNTFFGNMYGVYEVGPALTDVRNNLFYVHEKSAIEIVATLDPNDVPERILNIEHNTCDYGWTYGIIFHGMDDPNGPMPYVVLANNVMTENYGCGLYLNGCFHYMSLSNGYHMNEYDKNYDFMEFNPVHSAIYPYQPEFGDDPRLWHRFVPDCNFIDAGLVSIAQTSLVGMSTDLEGRPDSGMLDLGYHYMDWNFIRTSGVDDILAIADYWLCYDPADPNSPNYVDPNFVTDPNDLADLLQFGGDLDHSGFVDLEDFAVLSRSWRAAPDAPDLVPVIGGNPDEGWIALTASQPSTDTAFVYAYINGQYIGQVYSAGSNIEKYCDLTNFGNRPLEIKFIVMDMDENVTNSLPCLYEPDEPLSLKYCILPKTYEPNQPLPFAACGSLSSEDTVTVNVYSYDDEPVWSQTFTGNTVKGQIPAEITGNHYLTGIKMVPNSGDANVSKATARREPQSPPDPNIMALVVSPSAVLTFSDRTIHKHVLAALEDQGIPYKILALGEATYANMKKYAPQIKYLYMDAHGVSHLDDEESYSVLRTSVSLADGGVMSAKASDFVTPPTWCKEPLPGVFEKTLPSFITMGFQKLRLFHFDGCLGAHLVINDATGLLCWGPIREQEILEAIPHNDMSLAFGMANGNSTESRFYLGWFNESESKIFYGESFYQWFSIQLWFNLSNNASLFTAICNAKNEVLDLGGSATDDNSPIKNFRIMGEGDMMTFRLSPMQE